MSSVARCDGLDRPPTVEIEPSSPHAHSPLRTQIRLPGYLLSSCIGSGLPILPFSTWIEPNNQPVHLINAAAQPTLQAAGWSKK